MPRLNMSEGVIAPSSDTGVIYIVARDCFLWHFYIHVSYLVRMSLWLQIKPQMNKEVTRGNVISKF